MKLWNIPSALITVGYHMYSLFLHNCTYICTVYCRAFSPSLSLLALFSFCCQSMTAASVFSLFSLALSSLTHSSSSLPSLPPLLLSLPLPLMPPAGTTDWLWECCIRCLHCAPDQNHSQLWTQLSHSHFKGMYVHTQVLPPNGYTGKLPNLPSDYILWSPNGWHLGAWIATD